MKKIIAFDCDGTLEISDGPILLLELKRIKTLGWRVGVCGNWELAKKHIDSLDFYRGAPKAKSLAEEGRGFDVRIFVADADPDKKVAEEANWKFIEARHFHIKDILGND